MSPTQPLILARQKLSTRLTRLAQLILRHSAVTPPRFYGTLSYHDRTKKYFALLDALLAKKSAELTRPETELLISSEMNCDYDFTCGEPVRYLHFSSEAQAGTARFASWEERIGVAYFREGDYKKCLQLITRHRPTLEGTITKQLYLKCLTWNGAFAKCSRMITQKYLHEELPDSAGRVFCLLQRAISYWHEGRPDFALLDCNAAWVIASKTQSPALGQRPAILWCRAQIHHALGHHEKCLAAVGRLLEENCALPEEPGRPINIGRERYLTQYQKLITLEAG